jgi:hypothetical protein
MSMPVFDDRPNVSRRLFVVAGDAGDDALRRHPIEIVDSADPEVAGAVGEKTGDPWHGGRRFEVHTTEHRRRTWLQPVKEVGDAPDLVLRVDVDERPLQRNLVAVHRNFAEGAAARGIEPKHRTPRTYPQPAITSECEARHVGFRESPVFAEMPEAPSVEALEALFGPEPQEALPILDDDVDVGVDATLEGTKGGERKAFGGGRADVQRQRRESKAAHSTRAQRILLLIVSVRA